LASQGLGGFVVKDDFAEQIEPIITGGTGSLSHEIIQPLRMPDKLESGTMNIPAIMGLKQSLDYINTIGTTTIFEKEITLAEKFITEISSMKGVRIIGKQDIIDRIAVISLDFPDRDNAEIASILDSNYGIMTRCGIHCAPNAHKTLKTFPYGTVRFSFGYFNTADDIEYIVQSMKDVLKTRSE